MPIYIFGLLIHLQEGLPETDVFGDEVYTSRKTFEKTDFRSYKDGNLIQNEKLQY